MKVQFLVILLLSSSCNKNLSEVLAEQSQDQMQAIHNQVAEDAVAQYELSVKGGDSVEICVRAQMVVAAYNQAKNETSYLKWKKTEGNVCSR